MAAQHVIDAPLGAHRGKIGKRAGAIAHLRSSLLESADRHRSAGPILIGVLSIVRGGASHSRDESAVELAVVELPEKSADVAA